MALHFPLRVNGTDIGHFEAIRTVGTTDLESVGTHRATIQTLSNKAPTVHSFKHRYGDGAWALVQRALQAVGEPPASG